MVHMITRLGKHLSAYGAFMFIHRHDATKMPQAIAMMNTIVALS